MEIAQCGRASASYSQGPGFDSWRIPWKDFFQEDLRGEKPFAYRPDHILVGRLATPVILATENTTCSSHGEAKTIGHIHPDICCHRSESHEQLWSSLEGISRAINTTTCNQWKHFHFMKKGHTSVQMSYFLICPNYRNSLGNTILKLERSVYLHFCGIFRKVFWDGSELLLSAVHDPINTFASFWTAPFEACKATFRCCWGLFVCKKNVWSIYIRNLIGFPLFSFKLIAQRRPNYSISSLRLVAVSKIDPSPFFA